MNILVEATGKTPRIFELNGDLYVWGVIIPENPLEIFAKLNKCLTDMTDKNENLKIRFSLGYFNTSSARFLYNFFKKLSEKQNVTIVWHYESDDEDIYESGKEFEEISGLKFEFIDKQFNAKGEEISSLY